MFFDKNAKRIAELTRKDPLLHADRITALRARGPEWWIRYIDHRSKPRDEKCPSEYQTETKAEKYYKVISGRVSDGTQNERAGRVTISTLADFYLEHKRKKAERKGSLGGYHSSKTLCKSIKRHIGKVTFKATVGNPSILESHFDDFPEIAWSPKTRWNYFKILHAVFSLWIKKHCLNIANPMDVVDEPDPDVKCMDYVPTQDDYERIVATALVESVSMDAVRLIGAIRYSGLRINEVLKWRREDIVLDPVDQSRPYFWAEISKQRRKTRVALPMVCELAEILREQLAKGSGIGSAVWPWKNPPYHLFEIKQEDGTRKSLYKLAGVQVPRPFHDFRKTVEMEMIRSKIPKEIRKAMMGHKTDAMSDWYTHLQRPELEEAVEGSYVTNTVTKKDKADFSIGQDPLK